MEEVKTMKGTLKTEYKGYTVELKPGGDYCAAFAADIKDPAGRLVSRLGLAGNTEFRAAERSRELIDFELALGS